MDKILGKLEFGHVTKKGRHDHDILTPENTSMATSPKKG